MGLDIDSLWDFGKPEISEQRFRAALASATGDEALIIQTQIARTLGIRKDFERTRQILDSIEPKLPGSCPEVRVRHSLELGRSLVSAAHPTESQTKEARDRARSAYERAFKLAREEKLDGLAIDALHMLAFVDQEPSDRLKWGREALTIVEASRQPAAKKWEGSIRNNVGYALHQLGRDEEALVQFKLALAFREKGSDAAETRVARWMVAMTLRSLRRNPEALAIQLRLERECDAAGAPDPYVFEELETIYKTLKDTERADHYSRRRKALPGSN